MRSTVRNNDNGKGWEKRNNNNGKGWEARNNNNGKGWEVRKKVKERDLVRKYFAEFNKFDHFEYGTLEMLKGTFNNHSMPKLSIFLSIPDAICLLSKISCQCS